MPDHFLFYIRIRTMTKRSKIEVFKDKRGKYRWRAKASNGKIIGTSGQGYADKRDCMHGLEILLLLSFMDIDEVDE